MRAVEPNFEGLLDRNGVKVGYAVWGSGPTTIVLAPAWLPVDSRMWKAQVPYLSRYFRVITVDPRGNGRSDRPRDSSAYADVEYADDLVAAMDAAGVERAVVVGLSLGVWRSLLAVDRHPHRFDGIVALASTIPHLVAARADRDAASGFDLERESYQGWEKFNREYWRTHYPDFLRFFFGTVISETHSTKQIEDCVGWGLGSDGEILAAAQDAPVAVADRPAVEALIARIDRPMLVIHGDDDRCQPYAGGRRLAELTGAPLITIGGGGHVPTARHPVAVNRWIRDFVHSIHPAPPARGATPPNETLPAQGATPPNETLPAQGATPPNEMSSAKGETASNETPLGDAAPIRTATTWTRSLDRRRKVLYLSSPIGLGHARRDTAIAAELRALRPDLQIDWLAQHPVTALLAARGETVHPASWLLASESAHWESEADEHDLHAFQSLRRMDEILVANFMVFADIVEREHYDLWVGDESWEVDYFLHENPELKRSPYVWMTDFVGNLAMPDGGAAEAALTADYNAEMIEQIARFPRVRDRALFVGDPQDVVPDSFGSALPAIREWTERHYRFTGYITGFDPAEIADRAALRAEFGWAPDERVCIVTVGGTSVGEHLIRRAIDAYPLAAALVPGLRMIVVTGPRIDPASLATVAGPECRAGLECHAYLPDLHRRLAACDLAVVQGGLTTTMELVAAGRPFIYVPLRHHFEQQFHVPHRLARYGAGRRIDYDDTTPERLAAAIAEEVSRAVSYEPVASGGAARAAAYLAELL